MCITIKKDATVSTWVWFIILAALSPLVTVLGGYMTVMGLMVPDLLPIVPVGLTLNILAWAITRLSYHFVPFKIGE